MLYFRTSAPGGESWPGLGLTDAEGSTAIRAAFDVWLLFRGGRKRGRCARVSINPYKDQRSLEDRLSVKVSGVQMLFCLRTMKVLEYKASEKKHG